MIPVWIEPNGSIEELFVCAMHLGIVLGRHHIMISLPVLRLRQMLLNLPSLLHWLSDLLNNPTLLHEVSLIMKLFNG